MVNFLQICIEKNGIMLQINNISIESTLGVTQQFRCTQVSDNWMLCVSSTISLQPIICSDNF